MAVKVYLKGVTVFVDDGNTVKRIPSGYLNYEIQRGYIHIHNLIDNTSKSFAESELVDENDKTVSNPDDYLCEFIGSFKKGGAESGSGASYNPKFVINTFLPTVIETNKTSQVIIKGSFLDFVDSVNMTAPNQTGTSISIISKSFDQLVVELTTNSDVQQYQLTLKSPSNQEETILIDSANISIYTPNTTGKAPELWVKTGSSNNTVVTTGGYEAENSGGNGWNEHAYFGAFTSSSRLEFSFKVDRLQGASNAYCFIRTNNQNNASTSGNPRVYISNGASFLVYAPNGSSLTNTQIAVGDMIDIVLEPNKYEVFKNGVSIGVYNGTVNLTNVYMTFTGYRVAKLSNINAKVY
ncbi:hypothetical protein PL373_13680 [Tenacibaculum maritimum]|nr:hypothetical protein [Tenacibaculum maritimum]MDB0602180.1 hypothetical protein [Tenacibaculum maritimum]MDB0613856.1 hypothetical protein [Tenacibaculum maritimum]